MLYIGLPNLEKYLLVRSITSCFVINQLTETVLLYRAQHVSHADGRGESVSTLVIVSLWGIAFSFVGWFPCFPVRGAWDRQSGAKCYGFGLRTVEEFVMMFRIHSASNMVLDVAIFLTPMVIFKTPKLKVKNLLAMAGVFAFGGV
jgi:hypothetical protein